MHEGCKREIRVKEIKRIKITLPSYDSLNHTTDINYFLRMLLIVH